MEKIIQVQSLFNSSVSVDDLIEELAQLILYNVEKVGISPNEVYHCTTMGTHSKYYKKAYHPTS